MIAFALTFALGSISSFVTLTEIAQAYETTTHSINENSDYNYHTVALGSDEINHNIQTIPHYCATNSC